jgi:ubiquinone/menaquinone biosynthesis C-methylase UbiE
MLSSSQQYEAPLVKAYRFEAITHCEMCGAPDSQSKILGQRMNSRQGLRTSRLQGISTTIKQCRSCGLIYANPLPMPSQLSDHYACPPESYWSTDYFEYKPDYFRSQAFKAKSFIHSPIHGKPKALDIGCGIGKAIKTLNDAGFEAWGLEPSSSFHEKALQFTGLNNVQLLNTSAEDATLPDSFFDFITFGAVFEHLAHPKLCLQRALRWLKPGGVAHIEVPSSRWLIEHIYHLALKAKGSELTSFLSPMHAPFHLYSFSLHSFTCAEVSLGFHVVSSQIDPCSIYYFPSALHPIVRRVMMATQTGMQLTVYLRKNQ